MSAKPKATAKAKRAAVIKAFGKIPFDDDEYIDYLYGRRHLAKVRNGRWRDPRCDVELTEIDAEIDGAIEKILKRDGRPIYEEKSDELLNQYCNLIVHLDGGPKRLLGMLRRLVAAHGRGKSTKTRTRQADNRSAAH
jgi:hypothetical protein